ncbi:hypothetical protein T4A_6448 [Trichinella pseudospiralis]|uniref:Uncharacterized protein n=1 Tax=Trichinella pseudospiralis TaxID=6337 RepID=A0A0V1EHM2_TRIPS|nr:hypothetical protein T4A_6448 [Trichinella pseudospiralis]
MAVSYNFQRLYFKYKTGTGTTTQVFYSDTGTSIKLSCKVYFQFSPFFNWFFFTFNCAFLVFRNVQAADMVVYVQNNLWSCLQCTLPPPCQIKFLWSLVADFLSLSPW